MKKKTKLFSRYLSVETNKRYFLIKNNFKFIFIKISQNTNNHEIHKYNSRCEEVVI